MYPVSIVIRAEEIYQLFEAIPVEYIQGCTGRTMRDTPYTNLWRFLTA